MSPTEARRAYSRAYYLANKDKWAQYYNPDDRKRRREANPEPYRAQSRRQAEKKRGMLREAKNRPCADCGGMFPPWVMDLDHVRGTKSFNSSAVSSTSYEAIRMEIEKCDAVCANCHRERTYLRQKGVI